MKKDLILGLFVLLANIWSVSCNLTKEVEIDLPAYEVQPVVECYLEPGQKFRLLLTMSNSYFDALPSEDNVLEFLESILVKNARVRIKYLDREVELRNEISVDIDELKFYNYISDEEVPALYNETFSLEIILADGREIKGSTTILPVIPIDSVAVEFRDTLARTLIFVNDPVDQKNYYRRMLHFNSVTDSFPVQDFITDDVFVNNGRLAFGHGFDLKRGEIAINTIFHIDRAYFNYLNSVRNSIVSNGNPFLQPGVILTNLSGNANPTGIFTGLSYDRVFTVIP